MKEPPEPTACDQALPAALASGCDYRRPLETYCARGGCHNASASGGLDLRPNDLLIARILEVPATHAGLTCAPGATRCDPASPSCAECASCPQNARLVDRANPAESWILRKMEPFVPGSTTENVAMGCGDSMPSFYTNIDVGRFSADEKACLTEFFTFIATSTPFPERFPCTIELDGGT